MQLLLGFIVIIGIILGMVGIALAILIGLVVLIGYTLRRFRSGRQKQD